ncbi:MAG: hypothetical protein ACR2QE_11625 [Acidimicrobiales bacterium]
MQRWSDHVRDVTGDYPQVVPGQLIDLTDPLGDDQPRVVGEQFGPGESLDVTIPVHLLNGDHPDNPNNWGPRNWD